MRRSVFNTPRHIFRLTALLVALGLALRVLTTVYAGWWNTPVTVVSTNDIGQFSSLAVVNGNPAISYFNVNRYGDLAYVRATDADGSTWGSPITVDSVGTVGWFTSLVVVNGYPAISYYDATNGDLKYVRATDANGSAWGSPLTLDSAGDVGWDISLAVVNDCPAISYHDTTNGVLKYVRATDADGSAWGSPLTLGVGGDGSSLTVVNGYPAISYYDATNNVLKYVRAADASGSAWGSPLTVASVGSLSMYTSLAVVNGYPAISYYDHSYLDLKYVRATDANGSAWGSPVTPDSAGYVGEFTSLAVVNGYPAISYYDDSHNDLKYVRAEDADGSIWGSPVTLDSAGDVGYWSTSLAAVNGHPAISYYDTTNGNLKYVYYTLAPEISVLGNGVTIADGNTSPTSSNHTDFGSVTLGQALTHTFTLSNNGELDLSISNLSLGGATNDFTLTGITTPATVLPSGVVTFQVRFAPSLIGIQAATVTIANNDGDENPYDFAIQGTGTLPEMAVMGNAIEITDGSTTPSTSSGTDFGSAALGQALSYTFTISNSGTTNLSVSNLSLNGAAAGDFSVTDIVTPATVLPAATTTFQVRFTPSLTGARTATVTITNNDDNENPYDFAIQGTGSNTTPVADAGNSQAVTAGNPVTLDGSNSSDPDGHTPLTYGWVQTGGPTVTLSNAGAVSPTFTAPGHTTVLTFTLTVTDSFGLPDPTPDEIVITITNQAPVADAGSNQDVAVGSSVMLDGSGSSDPDNHTPLSYDWAQTGGPTVSFTHNLSVTTFTAPNSSAVLTFTLAVTDSFGLPDLTPDEVVITVTGTPAYVSSPAAGSIMNIGSAVVGTPITTSLTISETGDAALAVTSHSLSGPNAGDFAVTPASLTIPDGGAAQTLAIRCTPSADGLRVATLTVNHNAPGSSATYTLTCSGYWVTYLPVILKAVAL